MAAQEQRMFSISQLAAAGEVNVQTIRFYERAGILKPIARSDSGYRVYNDESLRRLRFIRHAKDLGFKLEEIQALLNLRNRSVGRSDQVRKKAQGKLEEVQRKITHLRSLERTLKSLVSDCENRVASDCCPIIQKMED